jgi:hypothetical protein
MPTEHFKDEEMTTTGTHGDVYNVPTDEQLANVHRVEEKLEEARAILTDYFGLETPVFVTYGYRSARLNALVGGSPTSAHMEGLAADTRYRTHTVDSVAAILMQHPSFMNGIDQLIIERGCLHFGLPCHASNYAPRHELRHDSIVNGVRTYPLVSVWHPVA